GVTADVWTSRLGETEIIPADRTLTDLRLGPDASAIAAAAELLAGAANPLVMAGAELPRWGGLAELVAIADLLQAPVSGDTAASRSSMGFPSDHPRYLGPLRQPIDSKPPFDVVLLAGTSRLTLAGNGESLLPAGARIIEIGLRGDHLARGTPVDVLLNADAQTSLTMLLDALRGKTLNADRLQARGRTAAELASRRRASLQQALEAVWESSPIAPERLVSELDRALESDAIVVTEGVSSDAVIMDYLRFDQTAGFRQHLISSGGSLGWGLGAGVGARLAAPDRQTVVLLGDGSFQFGVQALWTAGRLGTPLIVVIFNNRAYQANRWALAGLGGRAKLRERYIGINLEDPEIDHVAMARAYGLDGERVDRPGDLAAALGRAVAAERAGRVFVLDVRIARRGGGAAADWHEPAPALWAHAAS
ncbi:MAG: thiamine pyrophosphate-dependent enzyme, partial [Woeseiaceae bacterium]|nr:thiamine pyrophosphate-dependent enzyme [Woeseiaceae bacterium]